MKVNLINTDSKRNHGEFKTIKDAKNFLKIKFLNGEDKNCKYFKEYLDDYKFIPVGEVREQIRTKGGVNSIFYNH